MLKTWSTGCNSTFPLDCYLSEIRGDSLLTADEERTLSAAISRGDGDAKSRMIRSNLRLVVRIARDYVGRGMTLDDLVGEGNLGLIRATEEFDPNFGTRFSTYAAYWIKQAIRHALLNTTATIRLPAHMVGLLTKWRRAEKALRRELGRDPSAEQIGNELGLTEAQRAMVERALQARRLRLDTDRSPHDESESFSRGETADPSPSPENLAESAEFRIEILRRLARLDARERIIITLRFGLEGNAPLTLKEVGRRLGVTREWVRKIEMKAVRKLEDAPADASPFPARSRNAAGPARATQMA